MAKTVLNHFFLDCERMLFCFLTGELLICSKGYSALVVLRK